MPGTGPLKPQRASSHRYLLLTIRMSLSRFLAPSSSQLYLDSSTPPPSSLVHDFPCSNNGIETPGFWCFRTSPVFRVLSSTLLPGFSGPESSVYRDSPIHDCSALSPMPYSWFAVRYVRGFYLMLPPDTPLLVMPLPRWCCSSVR